MRIRHLITALCAATLTLAGCAASTDSPKQEGIGDDSVSISGPGFRTADAETAELGSDAEPGQFPRTVRHAAGETEIAKKPERIVVIDSGELDATLSLGVTPIAAALPDAGALPAYLREKAGDIKLVGTLAEPDLEAIAALDPDLILSSRLRVGQIYQDLSSIAPTVLSIRPGTPWKENVRLFADALGLEDAHDRVMSAYNRRIEELRPKVPHHETVSLVRFMPKEIRLYARSSFIGVILEDLGMARPKIVDVDELRVTVSQERITDGDGDRIFYTAYSAAGRELEKQVVGGRLWETMGAVKAGRTQRVDDDTWFLGLGPLGADRVMDDLGRFYA